VLTDDVDDEGVLNAAVLVPHDARVIAAVKQVRFVHSNAIPSVDPCYLCQTEKRPLTCLNK